MSGIFPQVFTQISYMHRLLYCCNPTALLGEFNCRIRKCLVLYPKLNQDFKITMKSLLWIITKQNIEDLMQKNGVWIMTESFSKLKREDNKILVKLDLHWKDVQISIFRFLEINGCYYNRRNTAYIEPENGFQSESVFSNDLYRLIWFLFRHNNPMGHLMAKDLHNRYCEMMPKRTENLFIFGNVAVRYELKLK